MYEKGRLFLVMKDDKGGGSPMVVETKTEALRANNEGYGVFYTVNAFNNKSRKAEDLNKILAWAIDIDDMPKDKQRKIIERSPLRPSFVIETKRGYHVLWKAENAKVDHHKEIMARLVGFYSADNRAKDLCRFLRMPGFYHLKDKDDPFLVKYAVKELYRVYTDQKMLLLFPEVKKKEEKSHKQNKPLLEYDNMKALGIMSGRMEVNDEVFSFKKNSSGYQIFVDDKSTSSWIDENGKIGSNDRGGPTIIQWLQWYGHSCKESIAICDMYEIKPEV